MDVGEKKGPTPTILSGRIVKKKKSPKGNGVEDKVGYRKCFLKLKGI
jgi:hypothetical protein